MDLSASSSSANDSTALPLNRVRTIMRSSPESMNLGQDAVFGMMKATEMFISMLARSALRTRTKKAAAKAPAKNTPSSSNAASQKKIEYNDLADYVQSHTRKFEFLQEIVPRKMLAKDCLRLIAEAQAEDERRLKQLALNEAAKTKRLAKRNQPTPEGGESADESSSGEEDESSSSEDDSSSGDDRPLSSTLAASTSAASPKKTKKKAQTPPRKMEVVSDSDDSSVQIIEPGEESDNEKERQRQKQKKKNKAVRESDSPTKKKIRTE